MEQALYDPDLDGPLVHHSDGGVQYLGIRYIERLAAAGIEPSVVSRGDSYDKALAETVIGLYKTEVIRQAGPWRGLEDVEYATLEGVAWYNTRRLFAPLGYLRPAEYEAQFRHPSGPIGRCGTHITWSPEDPGRFTSVVKPQNRAEAADRVVLGAEANHH